MKVQPSRTVVNSTPFIESLKKVAIENNHAYFANGTENDMCELLVFIFDILHKLISTKTSWDIKSDINNEELQYIDRIAVLCYSVQKKLYESEYSAILKTFYGMNYSTIRSAKNVMHSIKPEEFFMLDLPIPQERITTTLDHCISQYLENEKMQDENAWFNEITGKKENVIKQMNFWKLPDILIISLKRFDDENRATIIYPLTGFNMFNYVNGYKYADQYIYDLFAVSYHLGSMQNGGHYTCSVMAQNGQWNYFDDDRVIDVEAKDVINENAYCLFYRRRKK